MAASRSRKSSSRSKSSRAGAKDSLPRRIGRWVKRLFVFGLVCVFLGAAVAAGGYWYFDRNLPSVEALRTYQPAQVTKVECSDGTVCAEFFRERRTLVDLETLPPHVTQAFVAAEDGGFYSHNGVDWLGLVRAFVKGLRPGARMKGTSTISQQVCKNMLLSSERKVTRKIRELILTPRLEKALTKDQILGLYINQNYYGHGRYGIEEAALFYFGKHARELSVGEAASLAGTVQLPHRINPLTNMKRAKQRQRYVLEQMARNGFITVGVAEREMERPLVLAPKPAEPVGGYYTEEIRRLLVARYGNDAVLEGGLRVRIAMVPKLQALAERAVRHGLEEVDKRQGYRGAVGNIEPANWERLRPLLEARIEDAGRREDQAGAVVDLSALLKESAAGKGGSSEGPPVDPDAEAEDPLQRQADAVEVVPLENDSTLVGYVSAVDDKGKRATIDLVGQRAQVDFSTVAWARPRNVLKWTAEPKKISDVMKVGELVRVKVLEVPREKGAVKVTLHQIPEAQGGLVVIDPRTRHVVALVGGYDFARSSFNRATQAKRQPGSAFKPFIYGAALDSRDFTTISVINDAPEVIRDPWTGKTWKPQNYERDSYEGPMTMREAITASKNTVSVRLIQAVTPEVAIDFARRAGIRSDLPENLTLALGTGEVTMLDLTNGYATLHSQGRYAEPLLLLQVRDANGTILEEHHASFEERIPPATAYLVTSLMQSVVDLGTARAVQRLNRPAAGKTGTANENRDAWFAGYTTEFVSAAWVGFDDHGRLGRAETGGRAALPIWLQFMEGAHEGRPVRDFPIPAGLVFERIDPSTGLLAGEAVPGRIEPFLEGTAPTTQTLPPGQVNPEEFFLQEGRAGGF